MKSVWCCILAVACVAGAQASDGGASKSLITVKSIRGDVSVRRGVTESWVSVKAGEMLRPDDTFRTGKNGSATIVAL